VYRKCWQWQCGNMSMKQQKREPKLPKGPTAMGIKAWFELRILPMTSSGGTVRAVMGLVPPLGRANFILSPICADPFRYIEQLRRWWRMIVWWNE
jgi:hypothetical protein